MRPPLRLLANPVATRKPCFVSLGQAVTFAAVLLVVKVTASVVLGYRSYFPPDFNSDFLLGREAYFFGAYAWAFYVHLIAGPASLLMGLLLVSERFRQWSPRWHRFLGRAEIACVLALLVPSGLCMARYAVGGFVSGLGLAMLAVLTGACAVLGWRTAVQRRFVVHRRWMERLLVLLCSAVVIRLIGGAATLVRADAEWVYPASVWISWLVPLAALECWRYAQPLPRSVLARMQQT